MHQFARLAASGQPLLLLAPLASLGHRGLREIIARRGGCDLFFSEMISAEALVASSAYEWSYLDPGPVPERLVYQLVGANPDTLERAARRLIQEADARPDGPGCAGIDLNMGCSAPEMVRQGAGVHWMTQPDEAEALVARLRAAVPERYSLSAKIRIGEREDFDALAAYARRLESAGVDFITFHARVRKDPWGRPARSSWFGRLAAEVSVPLIANGDIDTPERACGLADAWRELPGRRPAGMMVGRAAVKRPWIFRDLAAALDPAAGAPEPRPVDLLALAEEFHRELESHQPRDFWLTRAKRFHAYFCQNFAYGHRLAANVQNQAAYGDILPLVRRYVEENPAERWIG